MTNDAQGEPQDADRLAAEAAREEQARTATRRRRWGCLVWIGILIGLPVLIVVSVGTVLVVADRQAEADAIRRSREAGDPVTPAEVRELYGATAESPSATAAWMAALDAVRTVDEDPSTKTMPYLGYVDAEETLDERGLFDEATLARVEPFLEGPAKDVLEQAHAARDSARDSARDVRYPFEFETSFASASVRIQDLRALANLLTLEAQTRTARGDVHGATESLLTLIAVSETLAEAPDLIAYLVRVAIHGVAVHYAMNLIDRADFPPGDLQRLQEAFARQDFEREMIRAIQGDQVQCLIRFGDEPSTVFGVGSVARYYPLRGADRAMTLSLHREFLAGAADGLPAADLAADRVEARMEELGQSSLDSLRYTVTLNVVGSFSGVVDATIRSQAQARMAEACCACERYRLDHGEYPPTLAALVPEYLAEVPLDPVDDQPLRYEVEGEKMIIHSIGHFRPGGFPDQYTLEDGFFSQVLGEPYVPEEEDEDGEFEDAYE